jgi:prefoldin subunit 5
MNQEAVREKLSRLRQCKETFSVVFSGKKSKRVNGLYSYFRREILIHNLNFVGEDNACDDNRLIYTAIHELAHHLLATEFGERGTRCHTQLFWSCFHDLLEEAERQGIYRLELTPEAQALADQARELSRQIAALQRELGGILERLHEKCVEQHIRTEDVFQRKLQLTTSTARKAIAAAELGLSEGDRIGVDQQAAILGARSPEVQAAILEGSRAGKTVEQLKRPAVPPSSGPDDELNELVRERERLETAIQSLNHRLALVKICLEDLAQGPPGAKQREAS